MQAHHLERVKAFPPGEPFERGAFSFAGLFGQQKFDVAAEDFAGAVAKGAFGGGVPGRDDPLKRGG